MFSNTTDLDLRLIRVFLAVADARGITAAESLIGSRQSTISGQLSVLETRLGFKLCERGRGGFRLTAKGERFAASARTLVVAATDFVAQVREMDRKLVGSLAIGLIGQSPPTENARLAEAIGAFRRRDQAVRFTMTVAPSRALEVSIVNKQLDLAIGYFWHRVPELVYTRLFAEHQEIYCGRGHPLFHSRKRVTVNDLLGFDWVCRSYHVPEEALPLTQRHITATTDNIEAATILILSGGHLGYLPTHHAEAFERRGLIRAIERDAFGFDVPFHLAMKRGSADKPVVQAFCENLFETFGLDSSQP